MAPAGLIAERYRLLRPLGAGSSATVWAAADETLGRQVALKLLSSATAADEDEQAQLRREARALAALTHPHIIVVFDFLETPGFDGAVQPVLITELLEGRSLAARLADGPLPWPEALSVCGQLADALAAAHRAGIVHRDVAPGNVMLTGSGVKLLDFGLAETIATARDADDDDGMDGMAVGTPVCMAPEQLRGEGALPASDVYALGCVLHWCLTGRPPYRDKDIVWLSQAHLRAEPPSLTVDGLPEGVEELYLACLSKDPDERPTAEEAAAMLAPYVPGSGARSGAASRFMGASAGARSRVGATGGASVSARGWSLDDDATELLPMVVTGGVATYVSPTTGAAQARNAATSTATGPNTSAGTTPPLGPRRHAGRGRVFDRRRLFPLGVMLAVLAVIALLTFGLTQTMDGGGTSATRTRGGASASGGVSASAMSPAAPSATATMGSVILPMGSAAASPPASVSASRGAHQFPSASPSSSGAASMAAPPPRPPGQVPPTAVTLPALPDPAVDPAGYVQGLGSQVQILIAQSPAMLQADAGQSLLNSLGVLQNDVVNALQHPGNKQQRTASADIAAIQQQISLDASAGQISGPAANLLSGELQGLADNLPAGAPAGNGNGNGSGANGG